MHHSLLPVATGSLSCSLTWTVIGKQATLHAVDDAGHEVRKHPKCTCSLDVLSSLCLIASSSALCVCACSTASCCRKRATSACASSSSPTRRCTGHCSQSSRVITAPSRAAWARAQPEHSASPSLLAQGCRQELRGISPQSAGGSGCCAELCWAGAARTRAPDCPAGPGLLEAGCCSLHGTHWPFTSSAWWPLPGRMHA